MVDFSSLGAAATETITRLHNYAKNVETAHLGKLYTTVINGLDYYVVECAAKPALAKAPEWVSGNRVVNSIQNNKGLIILAAGIITFIFIVVMLHPPGDAVKSTGTDSPDRTPRAADDEKDIDVEEVGSDDKMDEVEGGSLAGPGTGSIKVTLTLTEDAIARRGRASSAPQSSRGRPGRPITFTLSPEGDATKPTDIQSRPYTSLASDDEEKSSEVEGSHSTSDDRKKTENTGSSNRAPSASDDEEGDSAKSSGDDDDDFTASDS